ncbi:MAG: C40 family peptidase [bacterium]
MKSGTDHAHMHRLSLAILCVGCFLLVLSGGQEASGEKQASVPVADPGADTGFDEALLHGTKAYLGAPYRRGGTCANGIDCSGLSKQIYSSVFKVDLPHQASQQYKLPFLKPISHTDLQPGDLVFFARKKRIDHVGIYLSEGNFVHASRKRGVIISSLNSPYYKKTFVGARRLAELDTADDDVLATEGLLEYSLNESSQILLQFEGLLEDERLDYGLGWEDPRSGRGLGIGPGRASKGKPFSLEVGYNQILLDHVWNLTLSALWERSHLESATGSVSPRLDSAEPSLAGGDLYGVTRSGLRIASDIGLFRWLRITPSVTYFDYAEEIRDRMSFPGVFGLEAHMISQARRYDLQMSFQYGDPQGLSFYPVIPSQETAPSVGMSFAFRYRLTDLMRLSVMGQHSLFQDLLEPRVDSELRYRGYHDLFLTLDLSY